MFSVPGSIGTTVVTDARHYADLSENIFQVQEAAGAGVVAAINGKTVVVGNAALFERLGLALTRFGNWPERLQQRGQHVLFVAVDGRAAGFLGVIDSGV